MGIIAWSIVYSDYQIGIIPCSMGYGLSTMDFGLSAMGYRLSNMNYGIRTNIYQKIFQHQL